MLLHGVGVGVTGSQPGSCIAEKGSWKDQQDRSLASVGVASPKGDVSVIYLWCKFQLDVMGICPYSVGGSVSPSGGRSIKRMGFAIRF